MQSSNLSPCGWIQKTVSCTSNIEGGVQRDLFYRGNLNKWFSMG